MKKVILITLLIGMISSCTTNEERERLERDYPIVGKITSADGIGNRNIRINSLTPRKKDLTIWK